MAHFRNNYHFARTLHLSPEMTETLERIEGNYQQQVNHTQNILNNVADAGRPELAAMAFNDGSYTRTALMMIEAYLNCECREGAAAIRDELHALTREFPDIPILWEAAQEADKRLG